MELSTAIWTIVRELHRAAQIQRRAAARAPWGPVPLGLLHLAAQAPIRPSAAATELDVPAQSITRATAELASAGLAGRVADEADGRSYVIELSDEGRTAVGELRAQLTAQFAAHLDGWTAEEITTFAAQLQRLVASLATDVPATGPREPARNPWRST